MVIPLGHTTEVRSPPLLLMTLHAMPVAVPSLEEIWLFELMYFIHEIDEVLTDEEHCLEAILELQYWLAAQLTGPHMQANVLRVLPDWSWQDWKEL